MPISSTILSRLARHWPSPVKKQYDYLGTDSSTEDYHFRYALHRQYLLKVKTGVHQDFFNKKVLEIGCGHGGISVFLAVNGAREVHGIDINTKHLEIAERFKEFTEKRLSSSKLNVSFREMNALSLDFEDGYFDIVVADNIFEHVMELDGMMSEIHRVLAKGGTLIIPSFNSIYSKHGLHLKHGLKLPWANVCFSEKTICAAMQILAKEDQSLYQAYPGLKSNPTRVRGLREYGDLNGITYKAFRKLVIRHKFVLKSFIINPPGNTLVKLIFKLTHRLPLVKDSLWVDITSVNAKAVLIKN